MQKKFYIISPKYYTTLLFIFIKKQGTTVVFRYYNVLKKEMK